MRRIACLLLCLALCGALFACGEAELAPMTTASTTIEALSTAELLSARSWKTPVELKLSETITVYEVFNGTKPYPGGYDIWLRDSETGVEALLLEIGGLGYSSLCSPILSSRISERYFSFYYHLPETCDFSEVLYYDISQRRVVEADALEGGEFIAANEVEQ